MLTRLDLETFKCFQLLRLPLAPLTLLTGPNASGKSSVLQALVLLHQTMKEHEWSRRIALNGLSVRLGSMTDVVDEQFGRRNFRIGLETEDISCAWLFEGERGDMSMSVREVTVDGETMADPGQLRHLLPPDAGPSAASLARRLREMTYVTAERLAPRESYPVEDPYLVTTVGARGEHAVSVLHARRDDRVPEALLLGDRTPRLLAQVEARMRTLFPGFRIALDPMPSANAVALGLRTSDAGSSHRPIHTGFGLTQILPIIVALLTAESDDLVLIENPEIHLHPAGQALMGQILAEVAQTGVQVVVETHSDHVLNGVRRAVKSGQISHESVAIHFFRPRGEDAQVLSPSVDATGSIDEWPDGFFDQIDKDANYFAGWADD